MSKRIHVVQMFYTFDVEVGGGGLSLFAIELGRRLDPELFDVSLCSLGYYDSKLGQERIAQLNAEGIRAFEAAEWDENNPYKSFYKSLNYLKSEFSRYPVNILHSHSEYTDVTAILLKLQRKAPIVLRTVHYGYHYEWNNKPLRRMILTNFLYPILFDAEIGINRQNTNRLNRRKIARILRRRALRIPNAISFERFANVKVDTREKKQSLGIPPDSLIIGSVGRLADQKGYCYLIDAAAILLKEYPQAYFLIIGDGPLADDHKEQTRRLGIDQQVVFTGGRKDVGELLACMDLFASSSLWEGLPTVLLEAIVSNVPILATDIPGSNELIQHGINGWLVPPYSATELGAAMSYLLKSPSLRSEMALRAKETLSKYSIDLIAKQYEALYQELISRY